MNPILYLIYHFLKGLTKLALWIYYPRTTIINQRNLKFDRPTILVSNHPNTLLDPLNVAARIPMIVHFLANAGLFQGWFQNWFFNTFFCIPVERPSDVPGRAIDNKASFARASEFLGKGGCLYIAPEGTSEMERRLRHIKTGTARIALATESLHDFELGLSIMPVGLSYEAPNHFRSRLTIYAGEPIWIRNYREDYEENAVTTVKKVTRGLEEQLRSLMIDCSDEEGSQLLYKLEEMLRNSEPVLERVHFARAKLLSGRLKGLHQQQPGAYTALKEQAGAYFELLEAENTEDRALARPPRPLWLHMLGLIAFFPVFVYGWLHNILPAYIPAFLARRLNLYIGYDSTVKILAGLLTFPIFYGLQTWLAYWLYNWQTALVYLLTLPLFGLFAWKFWLHQRRVLAYLRLRKSGERKQLEEMREGLWKKVEKLL